MPTWPAELPQSPQVAGYSESPQSQVLRTQMDAGPAKTRRRFTAATRTIPVRYQLTAEQVAVFEAWFENVIAGGALPFDWPYRAGVVTALVAGEPPYRLTPVAGPWWQLDMQLELQP